MVFLFFSFLSFFSVWGVVGGLGCGGLVVGGGGRGPQGCEFTGKWDEYLTQEVVMPENAIYIP